MLSSLGPTWFLETDVVFDIIFFLVTLFVTLMGWRAYKFFGDTRYKRFTTGFFFITAGYLLLAITNLLLIIELREIDFSLRELVRVSNLITVGFLFYALFFLIGITYLLLLHFKVEHRGVRSLLFTLVVFSVLLSHQAKTAFFILSALLLIFLLSRLWINYREKRKHTALLVLLGFCAVLLGEILLAALFLHPTLYAIAGGITLFGYLCIAGSLVVR